MSEPPTVQIGVLLEHKEMYIHRSLQGLHRFYLDYPHARFILIHREKDLAGILESGQVDGLLGNYGWHVRPVLEQWGGPAVSILHTSLSVPMVDNDHQAIGGMAADFFVKRGYRHVGYLGDFVMHWSPKHVAGMEEALAPHGLACITFGMDPDGLSASRAGREESIEVLGGWLSELTDPFGLLCGSDGLGEMVLQACRSIGRRVPDDVSILAPTGKEWLSQFCQPPLSTINTDLPRVAYEAAGWLVEMIRNRTGAHERVRNVLPLGLTERASTDFFAHADHAVARAMGFARDHLHESIGVEDLAEYVRLSRSSLHRRFHRAVGKSPGEVIRTMRIDRAKQSLAESDESLLRIALDCGYGGAAQFSREFRKSAGISPSEFRQRHRRFDAARNMATFPPR